jgi:crotonobetainyl-CoA:carnitine CoA-transferase CaiB-like acyl-CoA transferase
MGVIGDGNTPRALEGLRVLDIGHWIAGPFGPTLLADFGADVIKVEQPDSRANPVRGPVSWALDQRNKRCITLALDKPRGRELFIDLVKQADVVVENFRPGTVDRLGIGYETLSAVNERLVMVHVSGFGQTGPYRDRPSFDRLAIAMGGLTYTSGYDDQPPVRPGFMVADYGTGLMSAFATLVAIFNRDSAGTGKGQEIDLALYETIFRLAGPLVANFSHSGQIRERSGNRVPGIAPGDQFETADGRWIVIHAGADHHFRRLFELIGLPEFANSPEFATLPQRVPALDQLNAAIAPWVKERDCARAIDELVNAGVPAASVFNAQDIVADPHFAAREMIIDVDDPVAGRIKQQAPVPKLSRTPGQIYATAPGIGEHNREVYGDWLGLDDAALAGLRAEGVI